MYRDNWLWGDALGEIRHRRVLVNAKRHRSQPHSNAMDCKNVYPGSGTSKRQTIINPRVVKIDYRLGVSRIGSPFDGKITRVLLAGGTFRREWQANQSKGRGQFFVTLRDCKGNDLEGHPIMTVRMWVKRGLLVQDGFTYKLPPHTTPAT